MRNRLLLLFLILTATLQASTTHLPLSEVAGEPSTIVAGHVNVIPALIRNTQPIF